MSRTLGQSARRYGPFVAVVLLVVVAIAVISRGDDGDDDRSTGRTSGEGEEGGVDEEQLTRDGPMTPQRAELVDEQDVDFGPGCDPETGRIRLPTVYAPQCVVPFDGDNGGATSPGVTEDEILLVRYVGNSAQNPVEESTLGESGVDLYTDTDTQTTRDYAVLYQEVFQTYGREVRVENYTATGPDDDAETARADARQIAEMEPFAVIDGPLQEASVFSSELAAQGILCLGYCSITVPEEVITANLPYIWPAGPTANQSAALAAEMIGNLAGPGPAELAGDPELQERDRVYALVHFDTEEGDHTPVYEALRDGLADHGIDLATDVEFQLDFSRQQENARTIVAQLEEAEVTTVIFYGDFVTPTTLTSEATAQQYFPEWILGPNLMADTAQFARGFDQAQWANGFGIAITPAGGADRTHVAYHLYEWGYGTGPPSPNFRRLEVGLRLVFTGIHLAGPDLTPESFRDGLFRYVPSGGGPTTPRASRGSDGVWEQVDYGGIDDAGILWWDPDAEGADENGVVGPGLYRHANGGQRYGPGEFPETAQEAGLFDDDRSVTGFEELPEEDRPPDYPPPF